MHLVGFPPLGGVAGLAGTAPIQIDLQIRLGEFQPRRTAIDNAANGRAVTLAEAGGHEGFTEAVA